MKKCLFVIGTRPEIIKTAPVVSIFKNDPRYTTKICFTGQHQTMAREIIDNFHLKIDYAFKLMRPDQSLNYLASASISGLSGVYGRFKPDLVFIQGDTTTAFCAAIAAFYMKIKVAHIEAGLRTDDKYQPYPEEINRVLISHIADLHFAPTKEARKNLIREGIKSESIAVTGNTVIDALLFIKGFSGINDDLLHKIRQYKRIILVTVHRRENFGVKLKNICRAFKTIAEGNKDTVIIYPVHLNPNILRPVKSMLGNIDNILLIKPLNYCEFIKLMSLSYLILTDSGGIQEEAPSFSKPVLILRDKTERPEVVKAGCAKITGTDPLNITRHCQALLNSRAEYQKMCKKNNPIGDGKASVRIKKITDNFLWQKK